MRSTTSALSAGRLVTTSRPLSFSNQRYHVDQLTSAKTAETRARRLAKSLALLSEGKAR